MAAKKLAYVSISDSRDLSSQSPVTQQSARLQSCGGYNNPEREKLR